MKGVGRADRHRRAELRAALGAAPRRPSRPRSAPCRASRRRRWRNGPTSSRARAVVAASADIDQARAQQWRGSLAGGARARFDAGAGTLSGTTWSIGPVAVSLPLFDAGARRENVVAARARYDEATSGYAATLRGAIRDVESALVGLQGTADRSADAQVAADNFEVSFRAAEARYKSGFGTLFELEDARRSALVAQITLIDLRRERVAAWIALYRALGGGWSEPADAQTASTLQGSGATP